MASSTTTSIKLDDAMKARLQQLAQARRRSAHWLMREAIAEYVEREELRDAEAAAQAQGDARARSAEAYAWLAQLEAKGAVGREAPRRRR